MLIVLAVCVIAVCVVFIFKDYYIEKTNEKAVEEVISIMDGYVPEIKELFSRNKEAFVEEISKDTPSDTIIVDDEKITIHIRDISKLVKNAVCFTVNSSVGSKNSVLYSISIVYFPDEMFDEHVFNSRFESFIKLDSNWYIYKEYNWGT